MARFDPSGRLLLGTNVEGHESADDFTIETGSHAGMTIRSGTSSQGSIYFSDATSGAGEYAGWLRYDHSANNMTIGTNSTEAIKIDNQQNFGIGGVAPNAKLHVKLDTNKHIYFQGNIGEIGSVPGFQGVTDAGALAGLGMRGTSLCFATGSSERLRIDGSGRLFINHTANTAGGGYDSKLQLCDTSYQGASISIRRDGNSTGGGAVVFSKSRSSTKGGNTAVLNGDNLGNITFYGADGSDANTSAATIRAEVDGTPGSNDMPGRLVFGTTADGASSTTERLRINSSGNVGINRIDPDQRLNVNGNIEVNAYDSTSGSGGYYTSKGLIIGNAYDAGKSAGDDRNGIIWQERGLDLVFATTDTERHVSTALGGC